MISKDAVEPIEEMLEGSARKKALLIAELARSKHAEDIVIIQVAELTALSEFFVLCSADSKPQMQAIADEADRVLSSQGEEPLGIEGREGGTWVLLDYNDVILHIFKEDARKFYNLDRLWGDAPRITLPDVTCQEERDEKAGG